MTNKDVVPFGKYKGQPVAAMQADESYCEWLSNQGWFRDKYTTIHQTIINNFAETTDTPEHNKLQALFLDDDLCFKLVRVLNCPLNGVSEFKTHKRIFEHKGWDISFHIDIEHPDMDLDPYFNIEIKPSLDDGFPAILRQMQINVKGIKYQYRNYNVLVFDRFTATSVSLEDIKKIFAASGFHVVQLSEIQKNIKGD